jgi:beta-lactamase superfamily II metal-dependent hydrolase
MVASVGFVFWPSTVPALRVTVLDVGQGDAILIQTPDGKDILIDGGPGRAVLRGLGENSPGTTVPSS